MTPIQRTLSIAAALLLIGAAENATAFSVLTSLDDGCHEAMGARAYYHFGGFPMEQTATLPQNPVWKKLLRVIAPKDAPWIHDLNDVNKFVLFSVLAGSRAPDTGNHSVFNLDSLRSAHMGPDDETQHLHFSRGTNDDYEQGNQAVIDGAQRLITEGLARGKSYVNATGRNQNITITMAVDFYNPVDVSVWGPAYYAAVFGHTVQDSFSHTLRNANVGYRTIITVVNWIDAISPHYREERDGIAHSEFTDRCNEPSMRPIVQALDICMQDYFRAVASVYGEDSDYSLKQFMDDWMKTEDGCNRENNWCDNADGMALLRREPTGPYLGCATIPGHHGPLSLWWVLSLGLVLLIRRQRQ